jgi:hypothetical protein
LKNLLTAFVKRFLKNKKDCFYRGITLSPPYRNFFLEIKSFQNQSLNNCFQTNICTSKLERRKDSIKHAKKKKQAQAVIYTIKIATP